MQLDGLHPYTQRSLPQPICQTFLPCHCRRHYLHLLHAFRWFLQFFDSIFSPIYAALFGLHVFGLGFVTSMASRGTGAEVIA